MDATPLSTNESAAEVLQAMQQYGPGVQQAVNSQLLPTATAQLAADQAVAPGYAQTQASIYKQFGPEMAALAQQIDRSNQLSASQTELDVANGPGKGLVTAARGLEEQMDPEFFKNMGELSRGISSYLGGVDPNKLSGAETEEISRALGREGPSTPSALGTVRNAMTFGNELQKKQSMFADNVAKLSSVLPNLRTGLSGFNVATKRNASNVGDAKLTNPMTGAGAAANATQNNLLGSLWNNADTVRNTSKSTAEQLGAWMNVGGQAIGGIAAGIGGA
jgi:hypothetical protein